MNDIDFEALPRPAVIQTCRLLQGRVDALRKESSEKEGILRITEAQHKSLEVEHKSLEAEYNAMKAERDDLQVRLQFLQNAIHRAKSERSPSHGDDDQQSFLAASVEHDTSDDAAPKDSDESDESDEEIEVTYKRKKGGRRPVSKELPVHEIVLRASDDERIGPNGERLTSLGFEISEMIDIRPEKVIRLVIKREKLGFPDTREYVKVVDAPKCLVPGGKATDGFMLHATMQKFGMGLPLYRQTQALNRLGADLADNFLGECVRHVATAFEPVGLAIREQILTSAWVFADETPIRQLKPENDSNLEAAVRTAYLWAWVGSNQVSFHYGPTRSSKEVRDVMGIPYDPDDPKHGTNGDLDPDGWQHGEMIGFLLCDGYAGYNPLFKADAIKRVACWVHARRGFLAYADVDKNAKNIIAAINALFKANKKIQKMADKQNMPANSDRRHAYIAQQRQIKIPALMADLRSQLDLIQPCYTPDSGMGRAITYINNRWDALQVFIDHGFLPMENNTAERAIRPIAVGRKAWLFVGSEDGGTWAATMFSIIESCRLQKIDAYRYCEYVLKIIVEADDRNALDYHKLTPAALKQELRGKA